MHKNFRWRWGLLAAAAMALVALIPQAHLRYTRGHEWQGAYAYFYSDEPAYAAYLNALIDGRPRRNDPYTGIDDQPNAPLAESLFSIQFFPAYLLALPARALGLSARTVFILLMPLVATGCALALFWLVRMITGDERAAVASVFVVLCLGILVSGQGFFVNLLGGFSGYVFLPFLRRYVPGVPLVFFFTLCGTLWRALSGATTRARYFFALASGALFAALVYSYFYHWTAAAALAACCALAWLVARPLGWRDAMKSFAVFAAVAVASLAPYFYLVSHRATATDEMQALTRTRAPDLWRGVELTAVAAIALLAYGVRRGRISWRDRAPLFTASLALSVLVVFNQQIATGLSLQPMHYEQYVGNYVALVALALACVLIWQGRARREDVRPTTIDDGDVVRADESTTRIDEGTARIDQGAARLLVPHKLWVPVALLALLWGACDSLETTLSFARQNARHDEWIAVTTRLDELARGVRREQGDPFPVVFNPDDFRMDHVPANTRCAVLWAPHTFAYSSLTRAENRERVFQFLHFAAVTPAEFAAAGRDQGFIQFSIFGWERANPRLASDFRPVTPQEIADVQSDYARYVAALEHSARPPQPLISFVVVSDDQPFSLANLEHFYTLEQLARVGAHTIYRATPK